jgi:hemolysin activation/secretion protein
VRRLQLAGFVRTGVRGATLAALAALSSAAAAQQLPQALGGALGEPGSALQPLPDLPPAPSPNAPIALPPIAPPQATVSGPRFFLHEVRIVGNTVLPEQVLRETAAPFLDREVSAAELEELRRRLTLAFVTRGYITSGAVLPDQDVAKGTVTYQIIEGRITGIDIFGDEHNAEAYIRDRLELAAGPPVNVADVERQVQLLLQNPLIERLNVGIEPGLALGESELNVRVAEASPYSVTTTIANDSPPAVGAIRGEINAIARNLMGWGDVFGLSYSRTAGLNSGDATWAVPITPQDTLLTVKYEYNDDVVIDPTFAALDIKSQTQTYEVGLFHPVLNEPQEKLTLGLALDRRTSKTFLLGSPFSFTPGVENGVARANVLRVSQDFIDRDAEQAIALRSTFSFGLPIMRATMTGSDPSGVFQTWLGQLQYVRELLDKDLLVVRADAQFARQPLFSFEQLAVGGIDTVRGYRENTLVRDTGMIASLEWRVPVIDFDLPWANEESHASQLDLVPFFDYGSARNKDSPTPSPHDISSVGLGLRWDASPSLLAEFYYAYALRDLHVGSRDLQDNGIHFRVTAKLY